MVSKTLILVGIMLLAGCQTPAGSFCAVAKPMRLTAETIAAMTDAEVSAALAHNRKGAALCGWKA